MSSYSDADYPVTLTEFDNPYPNPYAYQLYPIVAVYAREYGFDAICQFDYTYRNRYDYVTDYFSLAQNAQKKLALAVASYIFNLAQNLSVERFENILKITADNIKVVVSNQDTVSVNFQDVKLSLSTKGSVFLMSLDKKKLFRPAQEALLVALAGIRNTNSYWNEYYHWGEAPTLLEKVLAEVRIGRAFHCWKLDKNGLVEEEVPVVKDGSEWVVQINKDSPVYLIRFDSVRMENLSLNGVSVD